MKGAHGLILSLLLFIIGASAFVDWTNLEDLSRPFFSGDEKGLKSFKIPRLTLNSRRPGPSSRGTQGRRSGFSWDSDPLGFNLDFDFDFWPSERKAWWKGPNVCVTREESEDPQESEGRHISRHHMFTSSACDETETVYKCTTTLSMFGKKNTTTVTHECCQGYQRESGKAGCTKALNLKDVLATTHALGASEMVKALNGIGLLKTLREGNYTIFAPDNEAMNKFKPKQDLANVVTVSKVTMSAVKELQGVLMGHLTPGFVRSANVGDEQLLETVNPRAQIRVNFYDQPRQLTTANCVPVKSSDNLATNGVVHVVERVLTPATHTLLDLVSKDPHLSTLKTYLSRAGLSQKLKHKGQFTLFAPTNGAFSKLSPALLDKILTGDSCLAKVFENHLLPNVICSAVVQGRVKTRNLLDRYLSLARGGGGKLFVEGVQVVRRDLMASNGVLHVVDALMVPEEALNILDVAKQVGATEFLQLISVANLTKELQSIKEITMFIPTNEAIQNLPAEALRVLKTDASKVEGLVRYHVVPSEEPYHELEDGAELTTWGSARRIRIGEYSSFPFHADWVQTAQCSRLVQKDKASCNGIAHVVDKVLVPPTGDIVDTLAGHPQFSRLVTLIKKAGLAASLQGRGPYTVFAPTNTALENMEEAEFEDQTKDTKSLTKFIERHIIKEMLCCAGMHGGLQALIQRSARHYLGELLSIDRPTGAATPLVGGRPIHTCDLTATNGVVHAINHVLLGSRTHPQSRFRPGRRGRGRGWGRGRGRKQQKQRPWWALDWESIWEDTRNIFSGI